MKKRRFILTALAFIITITSLSCTKPNEPDKPNDPGVIPEEAAPKEYLTNVFVEEEVDFPDGFELLEGAMGYSDGALRFCGRNKVSENGRSVFHYFLYETGETESETMLNIDGSSKADFGFFGGGDLYIMDSVNAQTKDGAFESRIDMIRYDIETAKIDKVEGVDRLLPSMDENSSIIVSAAVDSDGYIYYTNGVSLCVLKPDFTKDFDYVSSSYIKKLASDGKGSVYMITSDSINRIDRETCAPRDTLTLPADTEAQDCWFGQDYDVYYSTSEGLFGWSEGMDAGEMAVNWSNSCIVPESIKNLAILSRDKILINYNDTAGSYRSDVTSMFTRSDDIDISEVTMVEIAGVWLDSDLNAKIAKFNKSHRNIRVVTKDYSDYDNESNDYNGGTQVLTNEILTGIHTPDLISAKNGSQLFALAYRDRLFADLYGFIDEDDDINRDDIVGIIKNTYELDGELGAIAPKFKVETLIAPKSAVGDIDSWTVGDIMDMADSLADDELLMTDRNMWVTYCSPYAAFIDMDAGTCSFDDPSFVRLMEYFSTPEKTVAKSRNKFEHYQTGKVKLCQKTLQFPDDVWSAYPLYNGEDFVYVGYPVSGEGVNGTVIDRLTSFAYMIPKNAPHPKEAWEFLKFLILDVLPHKVNSSDGIRALKSLNQAAGDHMIGYKHFFYYSGTGAKWNDEMENTMTLPELSEDFTKRGGQPGVYVECTEDKFNDFMNLLDKGGISVTNKIPDEVNGIIDEEISVYTSGNRSAEDTAELIQSRVSIWLSERY